MLRQKASQSQRMPRRQRASEPPSLNLGKAEGGLLYPSLMSGYQIEGTGVVNRGSRPSQRT